jgi:hypothetical protein
MARRRKHDDVAGIVAPLVGLAMLASMIFPSVRDTLSALGRFAILLLMLGFIGLVAFIICRFATRPRHLQVASAGVSFARQAVSIPAVTAVPRRTAPPPTRAAICETTQQELLNQLRSIDWFQFEKIVALAYRKHGYSVTRRGGANPDGGIDLLISKNGETMAVQCKQWKAWKVGVKATHLAPAFRRSGCASRHNIRWCLRAFLGLVRFEFRILH